jgi:ketosteroid isomerase-like protein
MNLFQPLRVALVLGASIALSACDELDSEETFADPPAGDVAARVDVMKRRIAASNAHDWSTWESLHTPDAVRTAPELDEPLIGAKAMRAGIEELVVTFPDYHLELVEAFGADDRLMARIHTKATMTGPLTIDGFEIPPTGKGFEQDWVAVLTFDEDLISAIDEFHDNYGILIQLGLTP